MANLIITVIAIALVAVASLMGAYYGGSAFLNNQSAAAASTDLNAGQQMAGAWQAFMSDNYNQVPDVGTCITGTAGSACANGTPNQYLAAIPNWAAAASTAAAAMGVTQSNNHYYAVADLGAGAGASIGTAADTNSQGCLKVVKTATGSAAPAITAYTPGAAANDATVDTMVNAAGVGNHTFGCAYMKAVAGTLWGAIGTQPAANHYVMAYKLS